MLRKITCGVAMASVVFSLSLSRTAVAVGTNTMPMLENFESLPVSSSITNQLGWSVLREVDIALVTNMATGLTSPLFPGATDVRALDIAGTVIISVDPPPPPDPTLEMAYSNFFDILVRPQTRDKPPVVGAPYPMIVAYIDNNENLVMLHSYFDPTTSEPGGYAKIWETNTSVKMPSNQWTRLTVTIDFKNDVNYWDTYYHIRINGGAPTSFPYGYIKPYDNLGGPDEGGGTWLMTANLSTDPNWQWRRLSSLSIAGTCQIDGFGIQDTPIPEGAGTSRTSHQTPMDWISLKYPGTVDFEARDAEDSDGDGMSTWQEYWAGTDPLDINSFFVLTKTSNNWTLAWMGGPNQDNYPFRVWRSTNLSANPVWSWSNDVTRAAGMTNVWIDSQAATDTVSWAFYKVTAPTNSP